MSEHSFSRFIVTSQLVAGFNCLERAERELFALAIKNDVRVGITGMIETC
jgi:hypothetical protein